MNPQNQIAQKEEKTSGARTVLTILLIPAVLFLAWAGFLAVSCLVVCGLGGSGASEVLMGAIVMAMIALLNCALVLRFLKKAKVGSTVSGSVIGFLAILNLIIICFGINTYITGRIFGVYLW